MIYISSLEIEDHIEEKIESKHGVTFEEAREACFSEKAFLRRSRLELYMLYGLTDAGRYLIVILVKLGNGRWRIATARGMTVDEKREYLRGGK
jgi:uncharacterized protein